MTQKILFITSTRIGDAVLSTGLLQHMLERYPAAEITIACGPLVASLFEGVPHLERLIVLKKKSWKRHWLELWQACIGTRWDVVVDLRNSAVSRLIWAREKYIFGAHIDATLHKVVQNAQVMGLRDAPPPRLFSTPAQDFKARSLIPDGAPVLGVGPTSNWIGKTWEREKFIALLPQVLSEGGVFQGWRVAVFGAPGEEDVAYDVLKSLPAGVGIDVIAKGSPGEAAACLARCQFYIGNDSGLMHSAAAAGVPTLGLFGPTDHTVYGPYGDKAAYVRTPESKDQLIGYEGFDSKALTHTLMTHLSVDKVLGALENHARRFQRN